MVVWCLVDVDYMFTVVHMKVFILLLLWLWSNRPLQFVLRGHVTNPFFKQWVGILLMLKMIEHIKIILHLKLERKCIQLRYFKACWFFNKAVIWFVLATIWDDMVAKFRYLAYILLNVKCFIRDRLWTYSF